jgi:hypothetical protein
MQGAKIPENFDIKKIDGKCVVTANAKGGMTRKVWKAEMIPIFIQLRNEVCEENEWLFVSLDGFDAHLYGADALRLLKNNKIMLFHERSNCSDIIQALDLSIF